MISFIVLFFPTFISLYIINKKNNKDYKEVCLLYPIYNVFINSVAMLITYIFKRGQIIYILDNFNILNFCLKYLIVAMFVALLAPCILEFIKKNLMVKIEIRRDNKKNEKSK